jgi:cobalt-zinc-cadmium efflux system outer membrane protein
MVFRVRVAAWVLAACLGPAVAAGKAQELTEQAALAKFAAENQTLQALEAQVRIAEADARRPTLVPNPSASYIREDAAATTDSYVTFQQSLPVNGRLGLLRQAGDAAVQAAEADAGYARWFLRSDLRAAFYSLLLAQEREVNWDRGVRDFQEIVRVLRERENAGEGSTFDRLRAGRELADAQAQRATARARTAQAQGALASFFALGTDASSLVAIGELALSGPLPPLEEITARALERRGDHLAEVRQAERYEYEMRAAQREKIPDPTLSGGLKHTRNPLGDSAAGYSVSMTVALPFFNRGQVDAARARAASDRSRAVARSIEQRIRAEVQGAYQALEIRMQMARDYGRDLGTAGNELARISQAAYQDGAQTILELLDSYRVALQSGIRHLELQSEARVAEIDLERAVSDEVMP